MSDVSRIRSRLDDERRTLFRDEEVIDVVPGVIRSRSMDGSQHQIVYSNLDAATADAAISGEIEHHRRLGVSFEWKLYDHDSPSDLMDRLIRHGFHIGPREAVLAIELAERPDSMGNFDAGDVVRIDHLDQLTDFRQVAEGVFEKDYSFTVDQLRHAIRAGSTQHRGYVAYLDGRPVSIGRLYTHSQSWFGGLYGGGTLAAFRGRGLYRAVVAARARDAVALGAKYLIVDALPTSRPILERLGFVPVTETWPCVCKP